MPEFTTYKQDLLENGVSIVNKIYSAEEVARILAVIDQADTSNDTFRKTTDLFAIRQFLKEIPSAADLIFTAYLFALIALPFILSVLSEKPIVKKGNAGIKLLVAEALVLILVWVFSPPGLINKIIYFVLWQVPVVVNFMTLLLVRARRSRRTGKRSIHENP